VKVICIVQDNLPINLLKVARATRIWGPKSQQCHICTTVSLTWLCMSQQCQWHRCFCHSGVSDSAGHVTAVCSRVRFFIKKKHCVELFPKIFEPSWHRCATNFVDYLREFEAIFEKALTCVSGTQGSCLMKKNRGRKSRVRVPLINSYFICTWAQKLKRMI
jgi:hypothetical protein